MFQRIAFATLLGLCAVGCHMAPASDATAVASFPELDAAKRERLLAAVKQLEGSWGVTIAGSPSGSIEFKVSSVGSAVRETMFPGTDHEMTNMYHLDGNTLVVTHYCGGGNQPRMRATDVVDGKIMFALESVGDLKSAEEAYMGGLTLEFVDADHVVEHWSNYVDGQPNPDHEMQMHLRRR